MQKFLLFLILLPFTLLLARENPFFPVDTAKDIPLTSNKIKKAPQLQRATLSLPSTARLIESVTVEYKNLDGSIATKKIQLHNSVDWHLPLFITQSYYEKPLKKRRKVATKKYRKIATLSFISFYDERKILKILTKDKMLRNFLLTKPHRIVCDFKRDTDIGSYVKSIKNSLFKKIKVGTHAGYYRVVIELDGYYQYRVKEIAQGYQFTLL